jgi:hypothetical protein
MEDGVWFRLEPVIPVCMEKYLKMMQGAPKKSVHGRVGADIFCSATTTVQK